LLTPLFSFNFVFPQRSNQSIFGAEVIEASSYSADLLRVSQG